MELRNPPPLPLRTGIKSSALPATSHQLPADPFSFQDNTKEKEQCLVLNPRMKCQLCLGRGKISSRQPTPAARRKVGKRANRTLCLHLPKVLLISWKKQATMEKAAVYPARLPRGYSCRDSESVLCPKRTDKYLHPVLKHTHEHTHSFPRNEGR